MDKECNKEYKFFCLWMIYLVQEDCKDLYKHLKEFSNTVICDWFHPSNTDDAGEFVARAWRIFSSKKFRPCCC